MLQDGEKWSGEPVPPWIALPDMSPDDPATQGIAEAYVVLTFLPFWTRLSANGKADYLDHWNASPEWRAAISERFEHDGLDLEAEAREADARQAAYLSAPDRKKAWWLFWKR
jgi:hypothetical protein